MQVFATFASYWDGNDGANHESENAHAVQRGFGNGGVHRAAARPVYVP